MRLSELKPGQAFLFCESLFMVVQENNMYKDEFSDIIAVLLLVDASGNTVWKLTSFYDEEMDADYKLVEDV
jgi:hypothetical protein